MAELKTEYDITPVAKPRQTRSDIWNKRDCVMKYRAFADECRASGMTIPPAGSHIVFILPMPKSWSAKKKKAMDGQPHYQVPDLDNMLKALADSLFQDDSHIYDVRVSKFWGRGGRIKIKPIQLLGD